MRKTCRVTLGSLIMTLAIALCLAGIVAMVSILFFPVGLAGLACGVWLGAVGYNVATNQALTKKGAKGHPNWFK
jgi:threonine/homoserine/homoserine lactone efflux protein